MKLVLLIIVGSFSYAHASSCKALKSLDRQHCERFFAMDRFEPSVSTHETGDEATESKMVAGLTCEKSTQRGTRSSYLCYITDSRATYNLLERVSRNTGTAKTRLSRTIASDDGLSLVVARSLRVRCTYDTSTPDYSCNWM